MGNTFKRYAPLIFIIILSIAAFIGYQIWNKPHENIKNAVALQTSAIKLYNSLINDSAHKKTLFINKIITVSGEVKLVLKNQRNQQVILLKTNISDGSVNCTMEENIKNIKSGDMVLIKGICIGYIGGDNDLQIPGDVFLIRCYRST
ncbi:MAG: hypothetical protein ABIR50_10085 [Ginsengibacter sp.]